jgi:REP element-mobilizing transposase RayT
MPAHHAYELYAHITWHTWQRVGCIDAGAADEVRAAAVSAGKRAGVEVVRGAVLADHVHLVVSFRPDTRLCDFVRLAKCVAATRANRRVAGAVRWARGYYAGTLHKGDLPHVLRYVDRQFERHPDLIPRGSLVAPGLTDPGRKPGDTQGGGLRPHGRKPN